MSSVSDTEAAGVTFKSVNLVASDGTDEPDDEVSDEVGGIRVAIRKGGLCVGGK